jgi:DNA-directed RNA polymerase specialized sigma24 family protein
VTREREAELHAAIARLTGRQRELLSLLVRRPELSYEEVSRELDMPVGSIGPTRERAFERLRADAGLATAVAA